MPTKSLLSSIYWCFNYPAGIQTLLCFNAAALSLKFMLLQTALKVYFCSCVVHQSQIWVKLYFLSQFVFLMWWIFPFCYCKQALAKQSSCQCKNSHMWDNYQLLSLLYICVCTKFFLVYANLFWAVKGLSLLHWWPQLVPRSPALLPCCCTSSALMVQLRPEHTSLLTAAAADAQTAFYFGWKETWVCAPGMQLQCAPAANEHLAHESRQELEVSKKTWDAHGVDTSLQHQPFHSATLFLSGLFICTTP